MTGERRFLAMGQTCALRPVTDDMALCHPELRSGSGHLAVMDAEDAWFLRVNHIDGYGVDPSYERLSIHPPEPLLFMNMAATPGATCLIWEHVEDEPGVPCPNPRVIVPRRMVAGIVDDPATVDVRSFGIRTPPCTADHPSYGIAGLLHVLPPALAWLWRLVAPRGYSNPSITNSSGLSSEGVGSYWAVRPPGGAWCRPTCCCARFRKHAGHPLSRSPPTSTSAPGAPGSCRSGWRASTWRGAAARASGPTSWCRRAARCSATRCARCRSRAP